MTSTRLRERRQEKVDAKHEKRSKRVQSKLESHKKRIDGEHAKRSIKVKNYKKDTYESRKKNYTDIREAHKRRTEAAGARTEKSQGGFEQNRQQAIKRGELAIARKELRAMLRGPENRASRQETREMLAEIFGDGDVAAGEQALRGFAHEVVDRQRADTARRKAESGLNSAQWRQRDTEKLIQRSSNESQRLSIASEEHRNRAAQNEGQLPALQARFEQARAEFGDDALETMTARQTLADVQAEAKDLRAMANEEDEAAKAYAAKVQQLREQLVRQQAAVREAEAGAAVERAHAESVARRTAESGYSMLGGADEQASSVISADQNNTTQS